MAPHPFSHVSMQDWQDWQWQLRNCLKTIDDVVRLLKPSTEIVDGIKKATQNFRMAITPYYASLIDINNPYCPIKAQAIPSGREIELAEGDLADPLHEDVDSPVP